MGRSTSNYTMILIIILSAFLELNIQLIYNSGVDQHFLTLNKTDEIISFHRSLNIMYIDYSVNTHLSSNFNISQNGTYFWKVEDFNDNDSITFVKTSAITSRIENKLNYEYIAAMLLGFVVLLKTPDMFNHVRSHLSARVTSHLERRNTLPSTNV